MGVYSDIQTDIGNAFDTDLEDAVKPIIFVSISETQNVTTGKVTKTGIETPSRAVLTYYKSREISVSQGAILSTDRKVIVLHGELDVVPKDKDEIKYGSEELMISDIKIDPAGAAYILQCRSVG